VRPSIRILPLMRCSAPAAANGERRDPRSRRRSACRLAAGYQRHKTQEKFEAHGFVPFLGRSRFLDAVAERIQTNQR
jgi:hypothetical protein